MRIIIINHLDVRFGRDEALVNIDLGIESGERIAVLGPNGAGKSTLFAAALGIVEPDAGSIEIGTDRVAFVPQRLDIEPAFPVTVTDVVRMGRYGDIGWLARFSARDHELVEEAIGRLRIGHLADRRFGDLSGGERQRALLAQAAAQDAQLLLLDEPFTGVDAPTREALRDLIDGWAAEGRTVLVATHDLESARRDYDSVIALNRRLIAYGPAEKVCTEEVLTRTFAGHAVRVGHTLIETEHHHD